MYKHIFLFQFANTYIHICIYIYTYLYIDIYRASALFALVAMEMSQKQGLRFL